MIETTGPVLVIMGLWPNNPVNTEITGHLEEYAEVSRSAGIATTLSVNILQELWKKLLINNSVNPLSALTERDTRTLTAHPIYGDIIYRLKQETAAVAKAVDVTISAEDVDTMYQLICNFEVIKISMLVEKLKDALTSCDSHIVPHYQPLTKRHMKTKKS